MPVFSGGDGEGQAVPRSTVRCELDPLPSRCLNILVTYIFLFCFSISLNDFLCIVADISTVSMRWTIEVQLNVEYKCRLYSS